MFAGQGPLRSFGSKISLVYALGIANEELSRDMDLIRKVRNHFAHNLWEAKFDSSPVREWCAEIRVVDAALDESGKQVKLANPPRERYLLAVGMCVIILASSPKVANSLYERTTGIRRPGNRSDLGSSD
jgi:hypothetical protein